MSSASLISRKDAIAQGLPRYFTGKPCKNGHLDERFVANYTCVTCSNAAFDKWYEKNPEKQAVHVKRWNAEHPEKRREIRKEWAANNPEKSAASSSKWKRQNLDKVAASRASRRSAEIRRTPKWLDADDLWLIGEAYALAALRTKMLGTKWHVDHIVPLQGKLVSGLHVPWNLQVIPAAQNLRKGNRF